MLQKIVFAGPSVWGVNLDDYPSLEFKPPAKCGDVSAVTQAGADAIGIIDGVFGDGPSIWHKEILSALHRGIPVYGSSSMGALRAAECAVYGMKGVGEVFDSYVRGERVSDADVAVVHGPAELHWQPLTVALVDVEASVANAVDAGELSTDDGGRILDVARNIHFSKRTWKRIYECAFATGKIENSPEMVITLFFRSVKVEDAKQLLSAMEAIGPNDCNSPATWEFSKTNALGLLSGNS